MTHHETPNVPGNMDGFLRVSTLAPWINALSDADARQDPAVIPDYLGTVEPPDFNRQPDKARLKHAWSAAEPQTC